MDNWADQSAEKLVLAPGGTGHITGQWVTVRSDSDQREQEANFLHCFLLLHTNTKTD